MKKIILVTGGAGFIGSRLVARLVADGHRVISLDNYFAGSRENHIPGVDYREGHTKDIEKHMPEKPDLIFHLGEYARVEQSILEPEIVHDLNTLGTASVIAYWKRHKVKLVYAGSSTKFGNAGWDKEKVPYVKTKAENTELVKRVGDAESLPYAITYFYNVYGPGERAGIYGTVIEIFKEMYRKGTPIAVVSPGTQERNFTHVDDIVDALILIGERGQGDEYGLGNEKHFSILEVAKLFGGDTVMLPPRAGNRMESALDISKTQALGWKTKRTLENYISEFTRSTARGTAREKRVLVFSTTFHPVEGPAEEALRTLAEKMPDVEFDVVTTVFSEEGKHASPLLKNIHLHRVGIGNSLDKYLLPVLGVFAARKLHRKHQYLFAWSIMASYAALAGLFLKRISGLPLLITLADQNIGTVSPILRFFISLILSDADQVYGANTAQEAHAARLAGGALRTSLGEGDAFANQLRYAYIETLLSRMGGRKKKILIFSLAYFPKHVGGAEIAIKEITDRIPDIEFHMVTNRFDSTLPPAEKIGSVLVHRIGIATKNPSMVDLRKFPLHLNKGLFQFLAFWKALSLHRTYRYNAIWAMMAHSCGIPAGLFKTRHPEVSYALTLQEGDPPQHIERTMRIFGPLFRGAFTKADVLQSISTFLETWGKRMGFRGYSIVVPNAVNTKHFSQTYPETELTTLKTTLGKRMGDVFLVTTSRLVHKNAVDDVIRALPILPENVKFLVLGTGPDEQKLKAQSSKLKDRILFLGHIGHDDLPKYLKVSDIFIRPSRSEGMGSSFVEAMAAGLPVIATQEGGIADFLFDEKRNPDKPVTGWAVDRDSPEDIARAVRDIMSNPEKTQAVVRTAKAMVVEKYDWNVIARDMREKVFAHALHEKV